MLNATPAGTGALSTNRLYYINFISGVFYTLVTTSPMTLLLVVL